MPFWSYMIVVYDSQTLPHLWQSTGQQYSKEENQRGLNSYTSSSVFLHRPEMSERHRLTWTVSPTSRPTLPDGVERMFLPSPDGLLELLVSLPKHYQAGRDSKPPLLFLHGGKIVSASWIIGFRFLRIG